MGEQQKIAAVAFDIDGTLYPNIRMYLASWPIVLRHLRLFRAFGRARKEVRNERPVRDLFQRTVELTAGYLRRDADSVAHRIERTIYGRWESSLASVSLYPGARDVVEWIRSKGLPTAAVSDFPVERKLRLLGIEELWDVAFSSEETGYLKPNPEPFLRLIDELGVPAGSVLYVGNSYPYDIVGARACGLITAHITTRSVPGEPADFEFTRFADLKDWIAPRLVET